ncbi:MAG: putative DNA binding domain-containing protein [Bacteroidales bacterium]|nr:putative DNA binding domain-containing protein [Bacteroidales bacterium]
MTEQELLKIRDLAEVGQVQFKERANDRYDIGCEMVAFSNSHGGKLVIGINDKTGAINALSYMELQETTNLLTSVASENVIPNVLIDVENVSTSGGAVVVATIPEGKNKPYHDNKGIIWVKNGADKRKVFDNSELAEMMSECGNFAPDEAAVPDATINDLDADTIKLYLLSRFAPVFKGKNIDELNMKDYSLDEMAGYVIKGITIERLLRNLRFIRPDGKMTVAAILLFGKYTQRWLPVMTAKCISYVGNSIGGTQFRDKMHDMEIEGNLLHQFKAIMNFFTRNLCKVQVGKEFNSIGEIEIPYESLIEYVVNALVHRSLNIKAPIRIFIFDNRVEIHSPGSLPNGLTITDIKNGTSMPRNMFLFTNANYLLPYTGAGSGVRRALAYDPNVVFSNGVKDREITHTANEFVIIIPRNSNQATDNSNQAADNSNQVQGKSNQVTDNNGNQVQDKSNQATDNNGNQVRGKSNQAADNNGNQVQGKSNQARTNLVTRKLTKKEEDIRNFCSVPRTAQEIMDRLKITNQSKNRQKYITALIDIGVLERTIPDRPNDPNQKYRRKR